MILSLYQLKLLHSVYYTPGRLASIYPQADPMCAVSTGTFFAYGLVLSCPYSLLGIGDPNTESIV